MFETLRRYLRHQYEFQQGQTPDALVAVGEAQLDSDARRFAIRLLEYSRRGSQHAWALKHLDDRFPANTIRSASMETRELWQSVIREQARSYRHEMALLRSALEPIAKPSDLPASDSGEGGATTSSGPAEPLSRIPRLLSLHRDLETAIQAAFVIQTDSAGVNLVQSRAFWRLMDNSEAVAAEIANTPLSR